MTTNIFCISINWCKHHGRSESLARKLQIQDFYIYPNIDNFPLRYLMSMVKTIKILIRLKPRSVIVMQPPSISLFLIFVLSKFMDFRIIGDLHTGVFLDPKWKWSKKAVMKLLAGDNCAVVTNANLEEVLLSHGVRNTVILDDLIEIYPEALDIPNSLASKYKIAHNAYVLVPLSYAFDEPLESLTTAIRRSPDLTWVLTGDAPQSFTSRAPKNVVFTGYVTNSEYRSLLLSARAVVALTTQESTMQRAGYEALCASKPLLISRKSVLVEYFGDSAVYVDNSSFSIQEQIHTLIQDYQKYQSRMNRTRLSKLENQDANLEILSKFL